MDTEPNRASDSDKSNGYVIDKKRLGKYKFGVIILQSGQYLIKQYRFSNPRPVVDAENVSTQND